MASHPRIRNIAIALVLALIFIVGTMFAPNFISEQKDQFDVMLDWVSAPFLVFGLFLLATITMDTLSAFWSGERGRGAVALYGLFLLVISNDVMRTYGITTRNVDALGWLENTYLYSAAVYVAFIGLWFLSHASSAPNVQGKRSRWGQLAAGIVIGAVIASSKMIEPALAMVGKFFAALIGKA